MFVYGLETNLGQVEDSFSEMNIRHAFLRKVYSLSVLHLAITTSTICLFLYEPRVNLLLQQNPLMFHVCFIMTLLLILILTCCPGIRRSFPSNLISLFLFVFFESFLLGSVAGLYNAEGVMLVVGICLVICLVLTIFAFQTMIDFTTLSGSLIVVLVIVICYVSAALIFPGQIISLLYASTAALIISLGNTATTTTYLRKNMCLLH